MLTIKGSMPTHIGRFLFRFPGVDTVSYSLRNLCTAKHTSSTSPAVSLTRPLKLTRSLMILLLMVPGLLQAIIATLTVVSTFVVILSCSAYTYIHIISLW